MSKINNIFYLYKEYFSAQVPEPIKNWQNFKTTREEIIAPLSERSVDFSTRDVTWTALGKAILELALKVVVVSYGIYAFGGVYLLRRTSQTLSNLGIEFFQRNVFLSFLSKH